MITVKITGQRGSWFANDLFSKVMHEWDLYTCCSAQGVRGLFNAWTNAVTSDDDGISVNLLINQISTDALIKSWLPYEGQVEVTPKRAGNIRIRVPSWVDERTFKASINGNPAELSFLCPAFAQLIDVPAGTCVTFKFPLRGATTREDVLGATYEAEWIGDTVMHISPAGPRVPLYRRKRVSNKTVPMLERTMKPIEFSL